MKKVKTHTKVYCDICGMNIIDRSPNETFDVCDICFTKKVLPLFTTDNVETES